MQEQLNPLQQNHFNKVFEVLGVNPAQALSAGRHEGGMPIRIRSIEQLQQLMLGLPDSEKEISQMELPTWPESKNDYSFKDLTQSDVTTLHKAIWLTAIGCGDQVKSCHQILQKVYFPMKATLLTEEEVTIKAGEVKVIPEEGGGHDPVIVNWGTLNLEEGGQIQCIGPVILNIQQFNKTAAR